MVTETSGQQSTSPSVDTAEAGLRLSASDSALIDRINRNLALVADLSGADLMLLAPSNENEVLVLAHGLPQPVPSLYDLNQSGRLLTREDAPLAFRALDGRTGGLERAMLVGGVPAMQEAFPVVGERGGIVAVLISEMVMLEHERRRRRGVVFRRAVAHAREMLRRGLLEGGDSLGRLGVHDGVLIIDHQGTIRYLTVVAEHLYRRLGYADSLLHTQLSELDTHEYVCFRAMERHVCLEQRIEEHDQIWIKRAIPLVHLEGGRWLGRLFGGRDVAPGAIVAIQDVTEESRKEQELKIKSAMIQEIHHRVKNNLQTIAALLRLQARRAKSPEIAELVQGSINRILSVAVVHEFLSKDESSAINIHEVCNRILNEVTRGTLDPAKRVTLKLEGPKNFYLPAQQATSCALIINELLQNSVEHGYVDKAEGTIWVRLAETEDSMRIEISDDGQGLPAGFDVTSGGLGLQIVRTLVQEDLKGDLRLENTNGVNVQISFPRTRVAS